MGKNHIAFGIAGETKAASYLKTLGYKILETNYENKIGEIDIISKDKNCLVFVEVKARNTNKFGRPAEAVTYAKQQKIKNTAIIYMTQNKCYPCECRFDVIEIFGQEVINHIPNAF